MSFRNILFGGGNKATRWMDVPLVAWTTAWPGVPGELMHMCRMMVTKDEEEKLMESGVHSYFVI